MLLEVTVMGPFQVPCLFPSIPPNDTALRNGKENLPQNCFGSFSDSKGKHPSRASEGQ